MKTHIISTLIFGLFIGQNLYAGSPLTSTNISQAYQDSRIIKSASKQNGKLNKKLMRYLTKRKKPIELKIAVINELGWDFDGKNNSELFYEFLKEKRNIENIDDASADILICYSYLKAMDNYFDVREALKFARKAYSKDKNSFSINIIYALIEAQKHLLSERFCKVFKVTNKVRENNFLKKDMEDDAIKIIFDYIESYKEYCKKESF